LIIHRLKVSGFKIMGDQINLDFPVEGRIGILGPNESGKTTLLEAVEYALYGLKRGRAPEESRENIVTWGKEEARLEIEFTSGQEMFLLRRVFDVHGGHKATLSPIANGREDSAHAVNSVTEIEAKIEQITGMDRDSFTKLVYVKQKDLDALKELAKARREQLVNKVMGIEVFDVAGAKVKSDLSTVGDDLEKVSLELGLVRKNSQAYEEKLAQRDVLQAEIAKLKEKIGERETGLGEAESIFGGYDWLSAYNSAKELLGSIREQRSRTRQDLKAITDLKQQLETHQNVLDNYAPEVTRLEGLRTDFLTLESRLEQSRSALDSLKARQNEAVAKISLTAEERELVGQDLGSKRQHRLILFLMSMVLCVCSVAVGASLGQLLIVLAGLPFGALAIVLYRAYQRIDRILGSSAGIQAVNAQMAEEAKRLRETQVQIDSLAAQTGVKSHVGIDLALSKISSEIKLATGESSVQAVEAVRESSARNLRALEESSPLSRLEELDRQLREKTKEIESLEQAKPMSAASLQYERQSHQNAKQNVEALRKELGDLDGEFQRKLGTINQLEVDLERLVEDFTRRPRLEAKHKDLEDRRKVLDLLIGELGETSKELRGKVIPHAEFIINQVLPTLTDGRYSQFEITEDLKFKAYSGEASGFKEREVFSGGTQDQFLIALRLAFTQSILDSRVMADRYSLLMDECISSSDEQRKQGIFEVLQAMKKTFSQIFIIAHEDISNFVDHHIVLDRNQRGYSLIRSKSW